jgi:integrase
MASAYIVTRKASTGRRFVVRYRLGGRAWPIQHGGSFPTMKEARARRDVIAGELAAGRNPADFLTAMVQRPTVRTFAEWAESYGMSRPDIGEETRKNMASHLKRLLPTFGERDLATITPSEIQEWIGVQMVDLKPSSLSRYVATLRQLLDFAGVEPNPARDKRVKLPKIEAAIIEPPSAEQVDAIISHSPPKWRLPLRVLEQTGMRVGELHDLEWRDVDLLESRFRIRNGKTATARRWVAVPVPIMEAIAETCPPDDRTAERRVFPGFSPDVAKNIMARASRAAGIPHFHPHDLRHRYASVKIRDGVPVTDLSAQLGHAKKSLTFDVYSHVLLDE